ncbi:MAG TPA: RNA polymerase sigma factor [Longimicrobium sp.]|jgi:RNA polymerase sigma-70 factor (ECF subfamily)
MADEDVLLVERALEGDAGAIEKLVRLHLGAAYAVALGVTGDPDDAQDVVQDAFANVLGRLHECRNPATFSGWLIQIVRNTARNRVRYRRVRAAAPLDEAREARTGDDPSKDAEREELRRRLLGAMPELTPVQREVLLLHDLEGWKHREIAEALEIPDGTVRYHLFQARRRLRKALGMLVTDD